MESYSVSLIVSLILVPAFAAVGMLLAKRDGVRDALCIGFAVAIGALSVLFSAHMLGQGSVFFSLPISWSGFLSAAALIIDLAVAAFIICYTVKYKRWLALAMAVVQLVLLVIIEGTTGSGHTFSSQMHVDGLSIIIVSFHTFGDHLSDLGIDAIFSRTSIDDKESAHIPSNIIQRFINY